MNVVSATRRQPLLGAVTVHSAARAMLVSAVVLAWGYGWVPSFISLTASGRATENGAVSAVPLAGQTADLLALLVILACVGAVLLQVGNLGRFKPTMVAGPLLLWAVLTVLHGLALSPVLLVVPFLVIAWGCVRPGRIFLYRLLARLGLGSAAISVLYAAMSPLAFMSDQWSSSAEKALIGDRILAGPFSHSNVLGIVIALTLPFVVLQFTTWRRVPAISLMAITLLWSASRISLTVAALALLLSFIVLWGRWAFTRKVLAVTIVLTCVCIVSIPLSTVDPTFLTNRGAIWIAALDYWKASKLIGFGATIFSGQTPLTAQITYPSTTGHNVFVTTLTCGGLLGIATLGLLLVSLVRRAFVVFEHERQPLLFLAVFLLTSIAEDPLRALLLGPTTFVLVPMLVAVFDSDSKDEALAAYRRAGGRRVRNSALHLRYPRLQPGSAF